MKTISRILASAALGAMLLAPSGIAAQTGTAPAKQPTSPAKTSKTKSAAPTAQEIADAKAKGMVWVNTSTKVYHKDGQFYGNTKQGKFMTEADAQKAGYKAAQEPGAKKSSTAKKTDTKK